MMSVSADESTETDIDTSSNASDGARDSAADGKTDRENREEYLRGLRAWTATVLGYQMYYQSLQRDLMLENYRRFVVTPNGAPRPAPPPPANKKKVPDKAPEPFAGARFRVPSLWKRLGAEIFDSLLFIAMKLFIENYLFATLLGIDLGGLVGHKIQDIFSADYVAAADLTSDLIIVEAIHRAVVCVNEIYWLKGGSFLQSGATIGKVIYGLQVIRADRLYRIKDQPNYVFATNCNPHLGWKRATIRSIAKNLFFPFLFPLPYGPQNTNQKRLAWDIMCGSIVVEGLRSFKCDQSQLIPVA